MVHVCLLLFFYSQISTQEEIIHCKNSTSALSETKDFKSLLKKMKKDEKKTEPARGYKFFMLNLAEHELLLVKETKSMDFFLFKSQKQLS